MNEVGKEIKDDKTFTEIAKQAVKDLNGMEEDDNCIQAYKCGVLDVARNARKVLNEGDIDDWTEFLENLSSNAYRLDDCEV